MSPEPPATIAAPASVLALPEPCSRCGARPTDSRETARCGTCYLAWSRAQGYPRWYELPAADDEDDEEED